MEYQNSETLELLARPRKVRTSDALVGVGHDATFSVLLGSVLTLVVRCATSSSSFSIAVGNATCVFGDLAKGNGSTTSIVATTFPQWIVTLSPDGFSSWTGTHPSLGYTTALATATGSLPSGLWTRTFRIKVSFGTLPTEGPSGLFWRALRERG
ncbi:hypothetical protein T4B_7202 [Trichinella pseudospiralis]|uniref:Uncharacterized protein n=1 Tax=Trichinella pseudospiralis TaxID=6337 RepID=A0A0V1JJK8_TRIPS|nr:hypothetical protein T4A_10128 [Trichinella pseudospiralis]KRZ35135.1 hypothetical protein T4B_7202 [Trichinella pseudospiralis]